MILLLLVKVLLVLAGTLLLFYALLKLERDE